MVTMYLNVALGFFISYKLVCDGEKNCPGDVAFDEIGCECHSNSNYTSQCKWIKNII